MDDTLSTSQSAGPPSFPLPDPTSSAASLLAEAFTACAERTGLKSAETVVDQLRRGDRVVHHVCEQELARNVAEYLSCLDRDIKAVYQYEGAGGGKSSDPHEIERGLTIRLVVVTRRRTAALISVLAALDRALSQTLADHCRWQDAAPVLNVHVLDDADIRKGAPFAALLSPPHFEPVPVWQQ